MKKECENCFSRLPKAFFEVCKKCKKTLCWGCAYDHVCHKEEKIAEYADMGVGI